MDGLRVGFPNESLAGALGGNLRGHGAGSGGIGCAGGGGHACGLLGRVLRETEGAQAGNEEEAELHGCFAWGLGGV